MRLVRSGWTACLPILRQLRDTSDLVRVGCSVLRAVTTSTALLPRYATVVLSIHLHCQVHAARDYLESGVERADQGGVSGERPHGHGPPVAQNNRRLWRDLRAKTTDQEIQTCWLIMAALPHRGADLIEEFLVPASDRATI